MSYHCSLFARTFEKVGTGIALARNAPSSDGAINELLIVTTHLGEEIMKSISTLVAAVSIGMMFACSNTPEPETPDSAAAADEARDARENADQAETNADVADENADKAEDVAAEKADVAKEQDDVEKAEEAP
jgi:hypothetical protein